MKLIKVKNYEEMTEVLLKLFVEQIEKKPDSVLSFTTGYTPEGLLDRLAERINQGLDVSRCIFCNLDEYVGKKDGVYSVYHFMHEHLYDKISNGPKEIHMMDAEAADQKAELERYAGILKKYPRDIQLLGLGTNGHIGANEPGTPADSTLFVADSCESTIQATQDLFGLNAGAYVTDSGTDVYHGIPGDHGGRLCDPGGFRQKESGAGKGCGRGRDYRTGSCFPAEKPQEFYLYCG